MSLLHLSDGDFQKVVLESDLPVLVDFWAPWCGPCKMISSVIDELSREFDQRLKVAKINIDDNPKVASRYGIMSIPTLMFFKHGKVSEQLVGVLSRSELKRKIEEHLQ
ncbi:MAG TPA: thioredoxin [Patescibacteria group bacterium]|nr:thioredoxin [Patescibacteria group bacterium]